MLVLLRNVEISSLYSVFAERPSAVSVYTEAADGWKSIGRKGYKMKKILAILLAGLMLFTLFACNSDTKDNNTSTAGTSSQPPASPSASDSGNTGGSGNAGGSQTSSSPAAPEGSASQAPAENNSQPPADNGNVSARENKIGFFMDDVDPYSRKTYDIVWIYMRPMALFLNITDALKELEPIFNINIIEFCANSDIDAVLQNIEIYADQGVDGFMIVIDYTANMRIKEVLDATGLPYIGILNSVRDENGSNLVPLVGMDGFPMGEWMVQWLYDNYKNYWGDIDTSKIGLLNFTFSPGVDFHDRHRGATARFEQLLPGNSSLIFPVDGVAGGLNEQTGYDLAAATFAAHPEVEYWWIPTCLELYGLGAIRAAEAANIDSHCLATTVNSDVLTELWDGGYEGAYVSCIATANIQYAAPAISGLVSLIDGTSTVDTLWAHRRLPGDKATFYDMEIEMLTIDTYKDFFVWVRQQSGLG